MSFGARDHDDHDAWDDAPRIWFSWTEILHLAASVVVLTVAFALILGDFSLTNLDFAGLLPLLPFSAIAVVPAFILHELAHKVVAQRKDMWAEFRANFLGLFGGLFLTAFSGLLFAVPGAVHIFGDATRRDSGVISIVGPLVNLFLGYAALILDRMVAPIPVGDFASIFEIILLLNGILAAFNMLPVGPLDGRKVWRWSILGFFGVWVLIVALFLLQFAV